MSFEQNQSDSGDELSPEIIAELREIEQEMWDPGEPETLEMQVFRDYYCNLPEVAPASLNEAYICFDSAETAHVLSPRGNTPYGPLFELSLANQSNGVLMVFGGSLVLNGQIDHMDDMGHATVEHLARRDIDREFGLFEIEKNKFFGAFTKGLCQDAYLIFFPAFRPVDLERPINTIGSLGYSNLGEYNYCGVRFAQEETPVPVFISKKPVFTEEKVQNFFVSKRLQDGVFRRLETK